MKLFYAAASPFARKVMAVAHESGLADRITVFPVTASPVGRDKTIAVHNPAGKIPTLLLEDGTAIYDSRVICEYLDSAGKGGLFPVGAERWRALVLQSLADEALDACLLARYETVLRPEAIRWEDWRAGQMHKVATSLDMLEGEWMQHLGARLDIGVIAAGCLLGYLDFRFADYDWRKDYPKLKAWFAGFNQRPSMAKTIPTT